ncbi:MAG: hypothetical protein ACLFN5_02460 [bacterium]
MNHPLQILTNTHKILSQLELKLVYTGGATIPLYLDDPSSPAVRPTMDTDVVVKVTTRAAYYKLEDKLRSLGLKHDISDDAPICRWKHGRLIIDIIPLEESILGFHNHWYKPGFKQPVTKTLPDNSKIMVFSLPYMMASKIEAFEDRGKEDFWGSEDFEDIVRLLDGCSELEEKIRKSDLEVKNFLQNWFAEFLKLNRYSEYISAQLPRGAGGPKRNEWILSRIEKIISK